MRSTTVRRLGVSVVAAGVALSTVAACGSSKKGNANNGGASAQGGGTGAAMLKQAVDKLASSNAVTVTLKVAATPDQIRAFAKAGGAKSDLSDSTVALITGASVAISTKAENGDISAGKNDTDFAATIGGATAIDVRYLSGSKQLFVKADVAKLEALSHKQVPATIAALGNEPQFAFIKDLLAGKWLELQGAAGVLQQFNLSGHSSASASAGPGALDFATRLLDTLTADVTTTDAGGTANGEHLVLSASLKKLAADIESLASSVPAGSLAGSKLSKLATAPDRTITMDAYVKDGSLASLTLDYDQLVPAAKASLVAVQHLPLELDFSNAAGNTSAPSGATPVDLAKLVQQFGPLLAGQLGGSGG